MTVASPLPFDAHRKGLVGHCYRMLGSHADAEDAVQDALIRAFRAQDSLASAAATRAWLYRIATRVCLDMLAQKKQRSRPVLMGAAGTPTGPIGEPLGDESWVLPIPDSAAIPDDADPLAVALHRESLRLAFVAALQTLPPRQRAALVLCEVLGVSAAEAAETLDTSVPSLNSLLQRARAAMAERKQDAGGSVDEQLVERYAAAFEAYDIDRITALCREDASLSMPPFALWLTGHDHIAAWMAGPGAPCRGSRLVRVAANGSAAFGQYRKGPDGYRPWSLIVLELDGGQIRAINHFLDTAVLFPKFGLSPNV